jgi:5'-3' exonuclease
MGAVAGVLHTVLKMIEQGATHIGVATDHVIESFRNGLWSGYKTGEGIEPALWNQFHPLEQALEAMGVVVWPMVELEADDALASAARFAAADERVEKVCIWTPDKDLAQCVVDDRVVQMDRRSGEIRDAAGVKAKFGVVPGADSRLSCAGRRFRRRLSGPVGLRTKGCRSASKQAWADRALSA